MTSRAFVGVTALLLLSTSPPARAQADNPTGVALSFTAGVSSIEDVDGPGDRFDGSDLGWSFDAEWRFIEYLGVGLTVLSLGEDTDFFNGEDTTIGVDGLGFYLRGYWPVAERVTLHARYGETNYDVDSSTGFGTFFPFSDEAKDFGVGADFYFTDRLAGRFEARWLDGPNREKGGLTGIGLRWQF